MAPTTSRSIRMAFISRTAPFSGSPSRNSLRAPLCVEVAKPAKAFLPEGQKKENPEGFSFFKSDLKLKAES